MKHGVIYFSSIVVAAFFAAPLVAWADANPDFDDDAKPGDDDHRPGPPFIFRARPIGSHGPYNLRLLIQPGEPGHILGVVDITKVHMNAPGSAPSQPAVANQPPPQAPPQVSQNPSAQVPELSAPTQPQQPAPSPSAPAQPQAPQQPSEPTADTPSGPIMSPGDQGANSNQPSLAPPPDPAPPAQ